MQRLRTRVRVVESREIPIRPSTWLCQMACTRQSIWYEENSRNGRVVTLRGIKSSQGLTPHTVTFEGFDDIVLVPSPSDRLRPRNSLQAYDPFDDDRARDHEYSCFICLSPHTNLEIGVRLQALPPQARDRLGCGSGWPRLPGLRVAMLLVKEQIVQHKFAAPGALPCLIFRSC